MGNPIAKSKLTDIGAYGVSMHMETINKHCESLLAVITNEPIAYGRQAPISSGRIDVEVCDYSPKKFILLEDYCRNIPTKF